MDLAKHKFYAPQFPHLALCKEITPIQLKNEAFAINVVCWPQAFGTDISGYDLAVSHNPSSSTWKIK